MIRLLPSSYPPLFSEERMMLRIAAPGLEVTKAMRHTLEAARAKVIAAKDPTIKARRLIRQVIATPAPAQPTSATAMAGLDICPMPSVSGLRKPLTWKPASHFKASHLRQIATCQLVGSTDGSSNGEIRHAEGGCGVRTGPICSGGRAAAIWTGFSVGEAR